MAQQTDFLTIVDEHTKAEAAEHSFAAFCEMVTETVGFQYELELEHQENERLMAELGFDYSEFVAAEMLKAQLSYQTNQMMALNAEREAARKAAAIGKMKAVVYTIASIAAAVAIIALWNAA